VLFLFVVMLLGAERAEDDHDELGQWQRPVAAIMALALLAETGYVLFQNSAQLLAPSGDQDFGAPEKVAAALFTKYLLPFEITGFILLAAVAGVVVLHLQTRPTQQA
jgi:NADH-quinone oxidoreductase subunit J